MILSSIIIRNILRVFKSLLKYYLLILELFDVKLTKFVEDELSDLKNSFIFEGFSIFSSIILSSIIIISCKDYTGNITYKKIKYLDNIIGKK